jgi:hypothetical protein
VVSGAFDGLAERIRKRISKRNMGFKSDVALTPEQETDLLKKVTTRDLLDYGFESEFIGRLPVTVTLSELDENSLYHILANPNCAVILAKKREFKAYGIELEFEDEALRELAKRAAKEKTGARGLLSAVEGVLIKFEKRLPSVGIKRLVVTRELMDNPQKALKDTVFDYSLSSYSDEFEEKTGIPLKYSLQARKYLQKASEKKNHDVSGILEKKLKDYIYGVKLMGINELEVTPEILKDPGNLLDRMIKQAYDKKAGS